MGDAGHPVVESGPAGLPSQNPTQSFWQTSHPNPITHHRSSPSLPPRASIVVIGTGISGTFATHELLNSHKDVNNILVLEARTTCSAATGRNGGHCRPLIHSQRAGIIDFEMRNYRAVKALATQNGVNCDFREVPGGGCLGFWNRVYFDEAKAAISSNLRQDSSETTTTKQNEMVRVVEDAEELKALGLTGGVVGALVQDQYAASLSPYKLIISMWNGMLTEFANRVNLQTETPVTKITKTAGTGGGGGSGGWIIHTRRGDVLADQVILATNGYTSHLLPEFEQCITPVQAQMSALIPPPESPYSKTLIPMSYGFEGVGSQDRVMSDYLVQNPILDHEDKNPVVGRGGHLMFGGGRHVARGNGVGVSDDAYVDADAEIYLRGLPARLSLVGSQSETQAQPELLDIAASWTGILGHSADGHPWVGGVPGLEGLFVCAGYAGHGMTNAGLCGRHVARLVASSQRGEDWRQVQDNEVEMGERGEDAGVPKEYVITTERMDAFAVMGKRTP
ncbi:FAD dependent oxidoreductase [Exophiala viscosa]|uniref:FAD dependent oxidoreductase n=1 Tax=Exophiala viscosa TaxID=2486360 RepID=A0AAN6IFX1_9EURO|nr:FAD dependent oxidoreductase [Exophiala viscosa]